VKYFLALGVVLAVSSHWLDRRPIREYGFCFEQQWWLDFVGALGIGVLTQGLLDGMYLTLGWARVVDITSPGADPFWLGIGLSLVLTVGIGIWEETIFRGIFIRNAIEGLGSRVDSAVGAILGTWVVSSVAFGILHFSAAGNFQGTAPSIFVLSATISGLYFGLAYILTGSLAFPIGLHISTNFAGVSLFGMAAPPGDGFASVVRLERDFSGIWIPLNGLDLFYVISLLGIVIGWVYATRGTVSINDSLLKAASNNTERE
jgi:hypothetical protein